MLFWTPTPPSCRLQKYRSDCPRAPLHQSGYRSYARNLLGQRPNEEAELRSFSLFRLALVAAYQGVPGIAGDLIGSISEIYTDSVFSAAGQVWLDAYAESPSIPKACQAVNDFATANPAAYEFLADYGYANPGFGPNDVCPVLDVRMGGHACGPRRCVCGGRSECTRCR